MKRDILVLSHVAFLIVVTKNEYVYESFSEEEESDPAPKPMKRTSSTLSAGAGDKKKGKANAAGQKSLMSFFGKK
jgi:hypothetical protein